MTTRKPKESLPLARFDHTRTGKFHRYTTSRLDPSVLIAECDSTITGKFEEAVLGSTEHLKREDVCGRCVGAG